ncbi:MAG: CPBP family intramembrane glutamic endopeptidase, partial [Acidobacteriota bacterium]
MSLRRPLFWSLFALLALVCTVFAIQYFPRAFPLVNLDIRMDRGGALQEARLLAEKLQLGPPEFEQAASFGLDGEVQNFVELEGGGKEAFNRLLGQELYSPYTWRVRHYREKETDESLLLFTPAGRPYGFVEKIPEDEPGAALPSDQARTIAEAAALREWKIDVGSYDRVEDSRQVRPGGRVDHTFVYEHPRRDIGGGRYRLRLTVSGDKPTEVTRFIKIPEGFQRRYQEMRSANQTIGTAASLAMAVLYILGGCVIGLFLLLRKGWVLWRQAVVLGVSLSLLQALAAINEWPLAWMDYDTALSIRGFVLQQTTSVLVRFGGLAILLSLSFMAAESLTRRAFPGQIQFWKIGSPGVANSPAVLGRTVAGYLLVPLFFGYEVTLYLFANRALGWWSPSNILFHPDVLATYFPWLSAIAPSLQAGFWEECLFRAVPLAGAALIGEKMGRRRAWIVGALVVQALIFGAGHAAYPNQPALARVVELIVPSLCFGGLYLSFGLLPSIILHFAFDTVWFAMPLFVASAPGLGLDKVLLVVLSLTPLWIVLAARIRAGRWNDAIDKQLNGEWTPPLKPPPEVETPPPWQAPSRSARLSPVTRRVLQTGGLIGIATWALWGNFQNDAPPLPLTRQQALEVARGALSRQSGATLESWTELAFVQANPDQQHQFIWQTAGDETYRSLLGSYLSPPLWVVRFAKFDQGDTEERAEEFRVYIRPDGQVWRFLHQLPEARSGASFSEQDARELALSAVSAKYKLQPSQLKEISAQPAKLPDRLDWTFTFSDKTQPLPRGETRIGVGIGGAKVVDLYRHVHVP